MELNDLRGFLAIAEEGSISKAAASLYMSQSNLSRQMQRLESEIGKPLFIRGNKKVILTEEGILLRKRAEEILSLYEKTEKELKSDLETLSGDIYIGGGESKGISYIARKAKEMNEIYPDVTFHFYSGDAFDTIDKLDKGLIDFGIFVDLPSLSNYEHIVLPEKDIWGLIMRKDSPLAEEESISSSSLKNLPLIVSNQVVERNILHDWFGLNKKELNVVATYNLIYNASLLVREGLGYVIAIDGLIKEDDELVFHPFLPKIETSLLFVYKKNKTLSKAASFFLKTLLNQ